ncbi:MAG: GNAT family N-acetyltransferase [Proteobacteria bacterium]|nr:GNAT family N-acetyltransferase [Pseudomonadota bacterium]
MQSALFGDARRKVEGLEDERWMALRDAKPVWMIRIEQRPVPVLGVIHWAPRGPTGLASETSTVLAELQNKLRRIGTRLLVTDQWRAKSAGEHVPAGASVVRTIWVDLAAGQDAVWARLHKGWRYGVRNAKRLGIEVQTSKSPQDARAFYKLCVEVSETKSFKLSGSLAIIESLLESQGADVEAALFVARCRGEMAGGALIMRCGRSAHYFWGAMDRRFRKESVGEAVQWAAIEWALRKGCTIYDLEGIDPVANPGTFAFKKKMGGEEVELVGKKYFPYDARGRLLAWLDARR